MAIKLRRRTADATSLTDAGYSGRQKPGVPFVRIDRDPGSTEEMTYTWAFNQATAS
jgi:hypothetical protein